MIGKKGYSAIEEVIVLIILALLIAVVYHRYKIVSRKAKTEVAYSDLRNLKLAIKLFRIKEGRFPRSLMELFSKGYLNKNTLQQSKIEKNSVVDPFGNPFVYDNKTGKVSLNPKSLKLIGEQ